MTRTFTATNIVTPTEVIAQGWITVDGDTISEIGQGNPDSAVTHFDGTLLPGFVDIHCHGGGGHSFDDPVGASSAAEFHLQHGTTSLLASLVSAPIHDQIRLLAALRPLIDSDVISGVHLEGPFLSHAKCGAQNPAVLVNPTSEAVDQLLEFAGSSLRYITIAPELPGALDAIQRLTASGVVVALGHSDATADQALAGRQAGATTVTHLFNAMRPVHHRDHGLADIALIDPQLSTEVIADGIHIANIALQLAATTKQHRLIAVTDAISAAGMPDGNYRLGGLDVTCADGAARLSGTSTLAGSTLTMDRAFEYLHKVIGLSLVAAAHATATEPARVLGLKNVGSLEVGKQADFVVWNNGVQSVFKKGLPTR